jgi:hypothetical protein
MQKVFIIVWALGVFYYATLNQVGIPEESMKLFNLQKLPKMTIAPEV